MLGFVLISTFILAGLIYWLAWSGTSDDQVPVLMVPYMVVVWSAVGAIAAILYRFVYQPQRPLETGRWLAARLGLGIIMGSFLYLVAAAGLIVLWRQLPGVGDLQLMLGDVNPHLAAVVSFLGGFSDRLTEEIVALVVSLLGRPPAEPQPPSSVG